MSTSDTGEFIFYAYRPSLPAAVIFTVLFLGSAIWHTKQLVQYRSWYFIPFVLGCLCTSPLEASLIPQLPASKAETNDPSQSRASDT